MKVIAIANQKGGVAKTTTAHAIGSGLKHKGKKVLYLDLDAQCNLTTYCRADTSKGLYNVLIEKKAPIIQHTADGDIIASTPALSMVEMQLNKTGGEYIIKEMLEPLQSKYDYCIIDTPPALSMLTTNALTGSDYVVIPAQADLFSINGLLQLKETLSAVRKYTNQKLKVLGIVIVRYNGRAILSQQLLQGLNETAKQLDTKVFNAKIRECIALKEAQATYTNIFDYAPKSNASADYTALINEILQEVK